MSPVFSIIAASASSVGKTFLIGLSGFIATLYPKASPLIPSSSLSSLSRMTFNMLLLPLIFTGVASSVKLSELGTLYPIILLSFVIIGTSFFVTLTLGCVFRMRNEVYFIPLCIASTFPNIVALPIIIFPTLCEYEVVQDLVRENVGDEDENADMLAVCNKQVNAVVFTYLFGFSVIFWSIGHRTLRNLKNREQLDATDAINDTNHDNDNFSEAILPNSLNDDHGTKQRGKCAIFKVKTRSLYRSLKVMLVDIITSSGFVALILGFTISCISPLQRALFDTGGSLRVFGSALESLSNAGTTFAVIIVAASLVARNENKVDVSSDEDSDKREEMLRNTMSTVLDTNNENEETQMKDVISGVEESNDCDHENKPKKCCWNFWSCWSCLNSVNGTTWRICMWQILSRLLVTPGIIFALLLKLDCSGLLDSVPHIAKLILLINSATPGALVVVVILKAEGLTEEAAAVSKTYLPSYTFSVFSLAMWSSLGLMAFSPDAGICGA